MNWIFVTVTILNLIVISVHAVALAFLLKVKRYNVTGSQKYLLVSLCLTEMTYAITDSISKISNLLGYRIIGISFWMFTNTSVVIMYIFVMLYITIDRFLEVYLNIKYSLHWTSKKTVFVLAATLVLCLLSYIPALLNLSQPELVGRALVRFIYPTLEVAYVITASCSYYYIIKQISRHRENSEKLEAQLRKNNKGIYKQPSKNSFQVLVPTLIIITFLLFMILPNIIKLMYSLGLLSIGITNVAYLFIPVGFIADPMIYIFHIRTVKENLWRLTRRCNIVDINNRNISSTNLTESTANQSMQYRYQFWHRKSWELAKLLSSSRGNAFLTQPRKLCFLLGVS